MKRDKPISERLASLLLNRILTDLEQFGGKCPKDERCRDLYEALERYVRDSLSL